MRDSKFISTRSYAEPGRRFAGPKDDAEQPAQLSLQTVLLTETSDPIYRSFRRISR